MPAVMSTDRWFMSTVVCWQPF